MGLWSWWRKRSAAYHTQVYNQLYNEFLEKFADLRKIFLELKEALKKRRSINYLLPRLIQLRKVHAEVWNIAESLLSMDKNWSGVYSKLGWFHRGVDYMFKYENNFDYDLALSNTLPIMENVLGHIETFLEETKAKVV